MSNALFVGRFQPLHNGHIMVIRNIAKEHDKVILIVGSAQEKRSKENPFSNRERKRMIEAVMKCKGIDYEVHTVKDYFNCKKWVRAIKKLCKFDVVYSTNPWTIRCFEEMNIKVKRHKLYRRHVLSGTSIREIMQSGSAEWKRFVPRCVHELIKEIMESVKIYPI